MSEGPEAYSCMYVEGSERPRTKLGVFFISLLIAGRFEVAGRTSLPGNGGLLGLFHEALETDFGCPEELGIPTLE